VERYGRRDLVARGGRLVGAGAALALGLSPESRAAGRLDQLDRALRGPLLRPGQAGYGAARRPWNARFDDVLPQAVAQPLDTADVDQLGVDPQLVPAPVREDLGAAVVGEHLAQAPDVVLHHLGCAGWRGLSPQPLDQAVGRDGVVGLEAEHRQQRPLLGAAERERPILDAGLDVSEDADLHTRGQPNHLAEIRSTPGLRPV